MTGDDETAANNADREQRLTEAFISLADTLVDDFDTIDLLHRLVLECVELFDAAQSGILLKRPGGGLQVMAASHESMHELELLQAQGDEGPCRDAVVGGEVVVSHDLIADQQRWPTFAPKAIAAGIRSVTAVPMRLRGQVVGALNLFSNNLGPLPERDVLACTALAHIATIGLLTERTVRESRLLAEQLQLALDSRVMIEQAKGILSHSGDVSMDVAFDRLRTHARSHQLRLREVAEKIIDGSLPTSAVLSDDLAGVEFDR